MSEVFLSLLRWNLLSVRDSWYFLTVSTSLEEKFHLVGATYSNFFCLNSSEANDLEFEKSAEDPLSAWKTICTLFMFDRLCCNITFNTCA